MMSWEEYQCTDAYRESHPKERELTKHEKIEELMRNCIYDIDEHNKWLNEHNFPKDKNGEVYDMFDREVVIGEDGKVVVDENGNPLCVIYICATTWNGRIKGYTTCGSYKACRMAVFNYDVANLYNEWQWAVVARETYTTEDELDDILIGYRESCYEDDYDYEY